MRIKKAFGLCREIYYRFRDDDVTALGAQLTYYMILAFFPFLLLLVTLAGLTPLAESQSIQSLARFFPENIFLTVTGIFKQARAVNKTTIFSFGTLLILWASSGGTSAAITAINKSYDQEENRPFWKVQFISILFTVALAIILLFSFVLLVFGELAGVSFFGKTTYKGFFIVFWSVIRFVLPAVIMFCVFIALYLYLPNKRLKLADTVPGAILSTTGWIILSTGFSLYVRFFGNLSSVYGSIGGVILLLMWLYWSSIILLLGGELNAALVFEKTGVKKKQRETVLLVEPFEHCL